MISRAALHLVGLALSFYGAVALSGSASAEDVEVTCEDATLWYNSRMSAQVVAEDGGACFFRVSLPQDTSGVQPGAQAAAIVQEAWVAPSAEDKVSLLEKTQNPLLEALSYPLLKDQRFAGKGGEKLYHLLQQNFSEVVVACTASAFGGKPLSNTTADGLSYSCEVDGNKMYRLALSLASVSVQVIVPLA